LAGDDTVDSVAHYIPAVANYVNPKTGRFDGAYGPRIRKFSGRVDQLERVYRKLSEQDPQTRRAVISIFDPSLDGEENSLDVPCHMTLQFLSRDGNLELIAYARSQDLFRGFVYDTAEWQILQEVVAGWLGLRTGPFYLYVGSAHVYVSDLDKVKMIVDQDSKFDLYANFPPQSASCARNEQTFSGMMVTIDAAINSLKNEFWKNAVKAIVVFNALKAKDRKVAEYYHARITNELKDCLSRWTGRVTRVV
jgi:thymidylate synthase